LPRLYQRGKALGGEGNDHDVGNVTVHTKEWESVLNQSKTWENLFTSSRARKGRGGNLWKQIAVTGKGGGSKLGVVRSRKEGMVGPSLVYLARVEGERGFT